MWDEKQRKNVAELLRQFNDADEVCAVCDCEPADLDGLCVEAFGLDFEAAKAKFAAQGRAYVRNALMQQAMEGNIKAIDMLAREQLGMDPVQARNRAKSATASAPDDGDGDGVESSVLTLIQGRSAAARRTANG